MGGSRLTIARKACTSTVLVEACSLGRTAYSELMIFDSGTVNPINVAAETNCSALNTSVEVDIVGGVFAYIFLFAEDRPDGRGSMRDGRGV